MFEENMRDFDPLLTGQIQLICDENRMIDIQVAEFSTYVLRVKSWSRGLTMERFRNSTL